MGLVAIHPQECFCFCCLKYILKIYIMLLLIVKVLFKIFEDFFSKVVL